MTNCSWMP